MLFRSCYFLVVFGWVFFRCADFSSALAWFATLFGLSSHPFVAALPPLWLLVMLASSILICFVSKNTNDIRWRSTPAWAVACSALLVWSACVILARTRSPFLYFQF